MKDPKIVSNFISKRDGISLEEKEVREAVEELKAEKKEGLIKRADEALGEPKTNSDLSRFYEKLLVLEKDFREQAGWLRDFANFMDEKSKEIGSVAEAMMREKFTRVFLYVDKSSGEMKIFPDTPGAEEKILELAKPGSIFRGTAEEVQKEDGSKSYKNFRAIV